MISNTTILNPEFRDENMLRNYPFSDTATFTAAGVEFPRSCILDALVRVPGITEVFMSRFNGVSKVIEFSDATGVIVGTARYGDGDYTIYAESALASIVENAGWYSLDAATKIPVGIVVPGELTVEDFQFDSGTMPLVPSCCLSPEPKAVEAIIIGSTRLSGPVVFRGTNGVVAYSFIGDNGAGDKVIKFQAIGSVPGELESCYSLPVVTTSICVSQQEGSPIAFGDAVLQGPFTVTEQPVPDEIFITGPLMDGLAEAEPNRYAGYLVDTDTSRARIVWHTYSGGMTHIKLNSAMAVTSFYLVAPHIIYMGHRSIYNVVGSGVFLWVSQFNIILDKSYPDGSLIGCQAVFYTGNVDGSNPSSICTPVLSNVGNIIRIDESVAEQLVPHINKWYEIREEMYSTIGDFCDRAVKMPLPDSDPVSDVEDPCLGEIKPDSGTCVFPSKDSRCYYPLNGRIWLLPARNIEGDRPLLGLLASSKQVINTVVNRSGTSSEITETRGTLTMSLRGMRINA